MRALVLALLALAAFDATAQSTARPRPPGTTALEEPPPLPPATPQNAPLEAQVTTRTNEAGDTVQEHRIGGRLYMQRVTPRGGGRAYVLVDNKGDGTFTRHDNALDGGVRVPQWVLLEF
jgi:hypothetical protein